MTSTTEIGKIFLNKELTLNDLKKGTEFEVHYDENYVDSEDESYFDEEAFSTFKDDIANIDDGHKPKLLSGSNISFDVLRTQMEHVTNDGKVLKQVLKSGTGVLIPDKSVVMVHYDAYLENMTTPFDSTRLRKRPFKFLFGDGNVLPGLELGIKTMKKDEIARILVDPEYAYGTIGCPPRIPPSSQILYEVQILNFYDSKEALDFDDMAPEDRKTAPFEKVVCVYQCENKMANDLFHSKCFKQAIARYRKTVSMLENVSVANEEEDELRKKYLLKLYLNLAQCFINVQNPNRAFIYSDLALKLDSENVKALYRMGIALSLLDEYEKAEYYLNKAKENNPYDKSINKAIVKLEFKRKQHLDWEKNFCKKAFTSEEIFQNFRELPESDEFIRVVEKEIIEFFETDEKELHVSPGYTENQIEVVKELARKYDLSFFSKFMGDTKINKIVKKT